MVQTEWKGVCGIVSILSLQAVLVVLAEWEGVCGIVSSSLQVKCVALTEWEVA